MKKTSAIILTAALTAGATACGGSVVDRPIADKQGAGQATYSIMETGDDVRSRGSSGLRAAQVGPDGVSGDLTWTYEGESGTATYESTTSITTGSVSASFKITYVNFSLDGETFIDGTTTHSTEVTGSENGGVVRTTMTGSVIVVGEYSGAIDADVTVEVAGNSSGGSISIDGTVTVDGNAYTFDQETLSVDSGVFRN